MTFLQKRTKISRVTREKATQRAISIVLSASWAWPSLVVIPSVSILVYWVLHSFVLLNLYTLSVLLTACSLSESTNCSIVRKNTEKTSRVK